MVNDMRPDEYYKKRNLIFSAEIILTLLGAATVYALTDDPIPTAAAAGIMLAMCGLTFALYRADDKYISGVTDDLSKLCDDLITLEEKTVFPENEDTLLSKLQSKILKLVKILKRKNETSERERENIKSLVSDISHQLKTPISNLKIYSELLGDETLGEEQKKEYAEILTLSVDRLNFLSESMIKISRLESGLVHLQPEMQDLGETVMISIKDVFAKAKSKGIEISYSGEKTEAYHDRRWTAEAVFNLLDNAVKYSREGAQISVAVKRFGMFAAVEVSDENEPIPEEERSRIFARFYRGRSSAGSEGIGVGLYLSREIAVKQGGYINLKVSENGGNKFSIVLLCR